MLYFLPSHQIRKPWNQVLGEPTFLGSRFVVAVDGGGGHQDGRTGAQSAQQVGADRQGTNGGTAEGGRGGDDFFQFPVDGGFSLAVDDHALVFELLGDVAWGGTGDLDPCLGEDRARTQNKSDVDNGLDWVQKRSQTTTSMAGCSRPARSRPFEGPGCPA